MGAVTSLARRLYPVGAALTLFPLSDIVAKLSPAHFSNVQWRFAGVGMAMSSLTILILGITVLTVVATLRSHRVFLKIIAAVSCLFALGLILGAVMFTLDFVQLRGMVADPAMKPQLLKATVAALVAASLATVAFLGLGRAAYVASVRSREPVMPAGTLGKGLTVPRRPAGPSSRLP